MDTVSTLSLYFTLYFPSAAIDIQFYLPFLAGAAQRPSSRVLRGFDCIVGMGGGVLDGVPAGGGLFGVEGRVGEGESPAFGRKEKLDVFFLQHAPSNDQLVSSNYYKSH